MKTAALDFSAILNGVRAGASSLGRTAAASPIAQQAAKLTSTAGQFAKAHPHLTTAALGGAVAGGSNAVMGGDLKSSLVAGAGGAATGGLQSYLSGNGAQQMELPGQDITDLVKTNEYLFKQAVSVGSMALTHALSDPGDPEPWTTAYNGSRAADWRGLGHGLLGAAGGGMLGAGALTGLQSLLRLNTGAKTPALPGTNSLSVPYKPSYRLGAATGGVLGALAGNIAGSVHGTYSGAKEHAYKAPKKTESKEPEKKEPKKEESKEASMAMTQQEEVLYNNVFLPAFVEKCASLGIDLPDNESLQSAIDIAAIVKSRMQKSANSHVKQAAMRLRSESGMQSFAKEASVEEFDKRAAYASTELTQVPEIRAALTSMLA